MARRNISLPDDLDDQARHAKLNVSALAERAVADELDRRQRMTELDAWLDELDAAHGSPSSKARAEAERWFASATAPKRRSSSARATATRQARAAG